MAQLRKSAVCVQLRKILSKPPVLGTITGLTIGLVKPLQDVLFGEGAALKVVGMATAGIAQASVPVLNLMAAFSLGHKLRSLRSWRELFGSPRVGISTRTLTVLTLGRMIFVPLLDGLIVASMLPVLPSSRLLRVLLFLEMASPTANIVVLLANLSGKPQLAKLCAFALLPQYMVGVLSLVFVIVVALGLTE